MTYTEALMAPMVMVMDRSFPVEALRTHDSLDLRSIGDKAWKVILESCNASELKLYCLKIRSLDGIGHLRRTVRLSIQWANKIEDVSPIFNMPWLASLFLSDLPRIKGIDGVEKLENLRELHLSGNLGSLSPPLRLESVRPIASLRNLEKLELLNLRLKDRDISFVADSFPNLRSLTLSGKEFERALLAHLAKRLNAQLDKPIVGSWEMKSAPCSKCGRPLHVFMGRRMPILCESCDKKRFEKLTREFQDPAQAS